MSEPFVQPEPPPLPADLALPLGSRADVSTPTARRLMLHWSAILPAAILIGATTWKEHVNAEATPHSALYIAIEIVGLPLAAWLIAVLAGAIAARSTVISTITFYALALCCAASQVTLLKPPPPPPPPPDYTQLAAQLVDHRMTQRLEATDAATNAATAALDNGYGGLQDPNEIDRRLRLVRAAIKANQDASFIGDSIPALIDLELRRNGNPITPHGDLDKQIVRAHHWDVTKADLVARFYVFTAAEELLVVLQYNKGHWTYDAQHDRLSFDSDVLTDRFNTSQDYFVRMCGNEKITNQALLAAKANAH